MSDERVIFDADTNILKKKVVSIIGYGNQGRAQGLILKDNGINVIVGSIKDKSCTQAVKDGFPVYDIRKAVRESDVAFLLVPDEVAAEVYRKDIEREIERKDHFVLDFASGYNITYGLIRPPSSTDVVMVAPRMIGAGMLDLHRRRQGYPVLIGTAQDISGKALVYAKSLAKGIGAIGLPGGVAIKSSFEEETLLDLLTEHSWVPILNAAMIAYFDVVTEEYAVSPEAAILELYASGELAEVAKLMAKKGVFEQLTAHSRTSQYGQLTRTQKFYEEIKNIVKNEAVDIWNGNFAKEWALDQGCERLVFNRSWRIVRDSKLARAEEKLYKLLGRR